MRNLLITIALIVFNPIIAQEEVSVNELYYEDSLAYRFSNDALFTGVAQKVRKNGHLVYEDKFENGELLKTTIFFNGKEVIPDKVILYHKGTFAPKTEIFHDLRKPILEYKHYDTNGKKTLVEIYTEEVLTYRCEYLNGKKHGTEFCINDDGSSWEKKYLNGKKI